MNFWLWALCYVISGSFVARLAWGPIARRQYRCDYQDEAFAIMQTIAVGLLWPLTIFALILMRGAPTFEQLDPEALENERREMVRRVAALEREAGIR